jgi:uncharacterized protein (TIGR02145 family)
LIQYLIDNGYNYDGSTNTPTSENKIAKALAAATGWKASINTGAIGNNDYPEKINITGFSALPAGYRRYDGAFFDRGEFAYFWSSSSADADNAHYYVLYYNFDQVDYYYWLKNCGYSVRCIKNTD